MGGNTLLLGKMKPTESKGEIVKKGKKGKKEVPGKRSEGRVSERAHGAEHRFVFHLYSMGFGTSGASIDWGRKYCHWLDFGKGWIKGENKRGREERARQETSTRNFFCRGEVKGSYPREKSAGGGKIALKEFG